MKNWRLAGYSGWISEAWRSVWPKDCPALLVPVTPSFGYSWIRGERRSSSSRLVAGPRIPFAVGGAMRERLSETICSFTRQHLPRAGGGAAHCHHRGVEDPRQTRSLWQPTGGCRYITG